MKKLFVLLAVLVLIAVPVLAHAATSRFVVQGPLFWHPFYFPGPFTYGYPAAFNYGYPGPFFSSDRGAPYTYGYPGPYMYGAWGYVRPYCFPKQNGMWQCS